MSQKEYYVETIERVRTFYVVPAKDEAEARSKIENREPNDGIVMDREDYEDLEQIVSVEENV